MVKKARLSFPLRKWAGKIDKVNMDWPLPSLQVCHKQPGSPQGFQWAVSVIHYFDQEHVVYLYVLCSCLLKISYGEQMCTVKD